MGEPISAEALDRIFLHARKRNKWLDKPVEDATLRLPFNDVATIL